MDVKSYMQTVGKQAREASRAIARADTNQKNRALLAMAAAIRRDVAKLLEANARDMEHARASGLDAALLDRLQLTDKTVAGMAEGLEQIAALPDPVGEIDRPEISAPRASRSARCGCRSASSASSTRRAPT